jgi:6-pyruvoyltetrahydropterin/6-carboxytetrahydropterin synthase
VRNLAISEDYTVRVSNDSLVFSAAHFITFAGGICEELHGHDFRVAVEVEGPLDENRYVVDFVALQAAIQKIVIGLDHRLLLPTEHPRIRVTVDEEEVEARFEDRRWVLPRGDCVLLPIANTTSELLAQQIGIRLRGELRAEGRIEPEIVRVEVSESSGRSAVCTSRAE